MKLSASGILIILAVALSNIITNPAGASIASFKKETDGVVFNLDKGLMKIKVCTDNIVEVKYTVMQAFPSARSLVINNDWKTITKFSVADNKDEIIITTANLKIMVSKITNAVKFTDLK